MAGPLDPFGWKLGVLYGLFCLFISGVQIVSAIVEDPHQCANRWGCPSMEGINDPAAVVCCTLLDEVLQFRRGPKPNLFLILSDEINAFSFQLGEKGALFITRGALLALSRSQLKVLLTRQLLHLRDPYLKFEIILALSIGGFCHLFFSGSNLLRYSSFGRFETRQRHKKGRPLYFIGILPLILGLPSWWIARIFLLWLDPTRVLLMDKEVSKSPENAYEMRSILEKIYLKPIDDMPPSTWPMRALGLHHESFLESIWPIQPSIETRLKQLKEIS